MLQHRAINLVEDVAADSDLEVRPHTEHVGVESAVVDRAQREAVGHDRRPALLRVRDDVRGVEQLNVLEPAHRARALVGAEDLRAEDRLVQAQVRQALHGAAPVDLVDAGHTEEPLVLADRKCHAELLGLVGHDVDGVPRQVDARLDGDEPDERELMLVRQTERPVLEEVGVGAAVGVADQPIGAFDVLVRRLPTGCRPCRADRQRGLELPRLADALLAQQERYRLALKREVRDVRLLDRLRAELGALIEPSHRRLASRELVEERHQRSLPPGRQPR